MITVREIRNEDDVEALISLGRANCIECTPKLPFDPECVRESAGFTIRDHERFRQNVWIAWKEDKPIGYGVGTCATFFFCKEVSSGLKLLYVVPSERGGRAAVKIVSEFEQWARMNGAVRYQLGVERVDDEEAAKRTEKLFPRLGYKWAGTSYVKEL